MWAPQRFGWIRIGVDKGSRLAMLAAFVLSTVAFLPSSAAHAITPPAEWSDKLWTSDLSFQPFVLTVFDDGTGPALYAGGNFSAAGREMVAAVAKWNGQAWSSLGTTGPDGTVTALAGFDDGSGPALYAAGGFTTLGGMTVNNIAKWNGTSWSALAGPSGIGVLPGRVAALAVWDDGSGPALYAGGDFRSAGGLTAALIAKWNGSAWSNAPSFSLLQDSGTINALTTFDGGAGTALYAAGSFTTARGVVVNNIAKWNGTSWSGLSGPSGTGVASSVRTLAVFDDGSGPALYAAGFVFASAGGLSLRDGFAKWNGTVWSDPAPSPAPSIGRNIERLSVHDDGTGTALYAVGSFATTVNGPSIELNNVAKWNGSAWSALNGPTGIGVDGWSFGLASFDDGSGPALYVVGGLNRAGGVPAHRIARWRDGAWSALNTDSGAGAWFPVTQVMLADTGGGPKIHADVLVKSADGSLFEGLARWTGTSWSPLRGPSGVIPPAYSPMVLHDDGSGPALHVFSPAGTPPMLGVWKWNGSEWASTAPSSGSTPRGSFFAVASYDDGNGPALYGGGFLCCPTAPFNNLAKWNGAEWLPVSDAGGSGVSPLSFVNALAVYDDGNGPALYVGGDFFQAGGQTTRGLARWNGTNWSSVPDIPGSTSRDIRALAVYDDGAGRKLAAAGFDQNSAFVAAWNGNSWTILADGEQATLAGYVSSLGTTTEGARRVLYAGGSFTTIGGETANGIARWDGSHWRALPGSGGVGVNREVWSITGYATGDRVDVWASGNFDLAAGIPSTHVAFWNGDPSAIFADGFEGGDLGAWSLAVGAPP